MPKALNGIIVASAAAFTVASIPLAAPISAASCDDVRFIFARGSGQSLGDKEYNNFKTSIEAELKHANAKLKYHFYELGSSKHGDSTYPAIGLTLMSSIGANLSAGKYFSYGDSVEKGITELKSYISEVSSSCPNTKFVLGGYSQGAQVITMASEDLNASKVAYLATFGDPKLYLPEGKGLFPDACRGKNLSPYREYAPNCRTKEGSLGAKRPYQTTAWSGKKGLWCNNKDIICGAGIDLSKGEGSNILEKATSSVISAHVSYVPDGIIASAAKTIVKKLQKVYPSKIGRSNSSIYNRDTIILIDRTSSMSGLIDRYKEEAKNLATRTIQNGGRAALYTYGDLNEGEHTKQLTSLDDSLEKFQISLDAISVAGGGDEPESMLSAIHTAMSEQRWKIGATKSIVVLTDASYHNPDYDGTTISKIVNKSYEIDPVNVYVINENPDLYSSFEQITSPTGGQVFTSTDSLSTDLLTTRPNVTLPLSEYIGAPGDEFTFTATASDGVVSYSWDLNFDGIFETTTLQPTITKNFSTAGYGYITVKATDANGNASTTSAKVTITNKNSTPEINSLEQIETGDQSATIGYSANDHTSAVLVSIDDAPVGFTDQTKLTISDLTRAATITLTPISDSGEMGSPISIVVAPNHPATLTQASQNTSQADSIQTEQPEPTRKEETPSIILAPNSGRQ